MLVNRIYFYSTETLQSVKWIVPVDVVAEAVVDVDCVEEDADVWVTLVVVAVEAAVVDGSGAGVVDWTVVKSK